MHAMQAMQTMQSMQANADNANNANYAINASKQTIKQLLECGGGRRKNNARLCVNRAIFNLQFLTFFK